MPAPVSTTATLVIAALVCFARPAGAQVQIEATAEEIVIRSANSEVQRLVRDASMGDRAAWRFAVEENAYLDTCRGCKDRERRTWTCSGYQDGDLVDTQLIEGYAAALQRLVDVHGAVVEHDDEMDVDYVSFPDADDPYGVLVFALLNDRLLDRPLVDYFRALELKTRGDLYEVKALLGSLETLYPDDPHFEDEWYLKETRLLEAGLSPFSSRLGRPVRIGLIDSGIDEPHASHTGLDGLTAVHHHWTVQPTGQGSSHALAIASLLSDAANDGEAGVGLLGNWPAECGVDVPRAFEIFSYNVGDFGPMSDFVADAVTKAIEDGVDVINLSMRIRHSAVVEEAIRTAIENGIVVVAAAGNYDASHATKPTAFPASMPGVIAVTGVDRELNLNRYSAAAGFDIAAPGEDILIGAPGNAWQFAEGTSYAAPHVTAAVALMKDAKPDLTSDEALAIVTATARQETAVPFLDALAALNAVLPEDERRSSVDLPGSCAGKAGLEAPTDTAQPTAFALHGNYPNPFNPSTTFRFDLPSRQHVRVAVYDVTGRLVATPFEGTLEPGSHAIPFTAAALPSGSYLYDVTSEAGRKSGVMILAK